MGDVDPNGDATVLATLAEVEMHSGRRVRVQAILVQGRTYCQIVERDQRGRSWRLRLVRHGLEDIAEGIRRYVRGEW